MQNCLVVVVAVFVVVAVPFSSTPDKNLFLEAENFGTFGHKFVGFGFYPSDSYSSNFYPSRVTGSGVFNVATSF